MLDKSKFLTVDPSIWTPSHARLIMMGRAIRRSSGSFVNRAIKKKLCETGRATARRSGKVRPIYGHDYHFHIRIKCPEGSKGCKDQAVVPAVTAATKSLAWWFTDEPWAKPTQSHRVSRRSEIATLADLAEGLRRRAERSGTRFPNRRRPYRPPIALLRHPAAATSIEAVISAAGEGLPRTFPYPCRGGPAVAPLQFCRCSCIGVHRFKSVRMSAACCICAP